MTQDTEELHRLRGDLIPLQAAAALAYERVYGQAHRSATAFTNHHVQNVMAHALAVVAAVYTFNPDRTAIRALDENDLRAGVFRDGAERLFYRDGRPQLIRLAIRSADLQKVVRSLRELKTPFEELPVPAELRLQSLPRKES
jgi:hypothetical protein